MESLAELLKKALAETYAFSLKAQNYHWNVEGSNFPQYHEFFGKLYDEVYGSVDALAELIRTLPEYAPGSFSRFSELSTIVDERSIPEADQMVRNLFIDNGKVLIILYKAYKVAEQDGQFGISNFIQDRITAHEKHKWMLRATIK